MARRERECGVGCFSGVGHDVHMVEKDPKDFLDDIADFLLPDLVGSGPGHFGDETRRRFIIFWSRVAEVGEDDSSSCWERGG